MSSGQYASRLGVRPSAVSNWKSRGKLTAPALRTDGMIDAALADRQLGITLDPLMSASARQRPTIAALPAAPAAEVVDLSSARDLLAARALSATIAAERHRRELEHDRGRYMLTAEVEAGWTRTLTAIVRDLDLAVTDLIALLHLDHAQTIALRRWWRALRERLAAEMAAAAEAEPEFVADPRR